MPLLHQSHGLIIVAMCRLPDENTGWWVMFIGRTVFGFGGESLSVAMSAYIAQWFTGKELALALGMNLALARVGSVINDATSQAIASSFPIYYALWAGFFVCIASFLAVVWAYYIDVRSVSKLAKNKVGLIRAGKLAMPVFRAEKKAQAEAAASLNSGAGAYQSPAFQPLSGGPSGSNDPPSELLLGGESPALGGVSNALATMTTESPGTLRMQRTSGGKGGRGGANVALAPIKGSEAGATAHPGFEDSPNLSLIQPVDIDEKALIAELESVEAEVVRFSDVKEFPLTFWLLAMSCLTVYCAILPFNNIAASLFTTKYHMDDKSANLVLMVTYLTAGVLSPFMGWVIDRVGFRAVLNVVAAVLIVGVHAVLGFTDLYPVAPLVVLGMCYSIYAAALWPSIALVVKPEFQGTAYGVVTAVQNAGLALAPVIISQLQPPNACNGSYKCVEEFFVGLGTAGILVGILLNVADYSAPVALLNLTDDAARDQKRALGLLTDEELAAEAAAAAAGEADEGSSEHTGLLAAASTAGEPRQRAGSVGAV